MQGASGKLAAVPSINGSSLRRIWRCFYVVAVFAAFTGGALLRIRLPFVPIADFDVAAFVSPALMKLAGGSLLHLGAVTSIYPAGLYGLLLTFHDFRAAAVVQHGLGVAAAAMFLLGWRRVHDLLGAPRLRREVHEAIGLFGAVVYLFSNKPVVFELTLRADAVCMFFQMLTVWFVIATFHAQQRGRAAFTVAAFAFAATTAAGFLAVLKPSFTFFAVLTIAVATAPVWRLHSRRIAAGFVAAVAVTLSFIVIPEALRSQSDPRTKRFLTETLFAVHARLIGVQMQRDVAAGNSGNYDRNFLAEAATQLDEEIQRSAAIDGALLPTIGFHPDALMVGDNALFGRWQTKLGSEAALAQFLRHYYWCALLRRPHAFAWKIVQQLGVFYGPACPAFSTYRVLPLAPRYYEQTLAAMAARGVDVLLKQFEFGRAYLTRAAKLQTTAISVSESKWLLFWNRLLAHAYLPIVVLAWIAIGIDALRQRTTPPLPVIYLLLVNFSHVLPIAVVHTMHIDRYYNVQFAAAIVVELISVRWLIEVCLRRAAWTPARPNAFDAMDALR